MVKSGAVLTFGPPAGHTDITGPIRLIASGEMRVVFIEVKTGEGDLEPEQIKFKKMIYAMGGEKYYCLARSLQDVIDFYLRVANG